MNIIFGERRSGKTTELIKQCSQDKYSLIVAPNTCMCDCIYQQSKEMGYSIPQPITFRDFLHGKFYEHAVEKFYFDELKRSIPYDVGVYEPSGDIWKPLKCVKKARQVTRKRSVAEMLLMMFRSSNRELIKEARRNDL